MCMFAHSKLELLFSSVRKPHRLRFNENSNGISRTSKMNCASHKHTTLCLVLIICTCSLCVSTLTKVKSTGCVLFDVYLCLTKQLLHLLLLFCQWAKANTKHMCNLARVLWNVSMQHPPHEPKYAVWYWWQQASAYCCHVLFFTLQWISIYEQFVSAFASNQFVYCDVFLRRLCRCSATDDRQNTRYESKR